MIMEFNPFLTSPVVATLIFDKGIYAGSNTFALPSEQVST